MKSPIFKSALALLLTAALVFTSATGSLASQTSVSENSVSENSASDIIPAVSDNNIITSEDTTEYPTVTDTAETALTPDNESEYYSVSGTTYTVNAVNGTDITTALNAALYDASQVANAGNIFTVKVPAGSYTLSGTLHMYSNTVLSMYGATFTANSSIALTMLMLGTQSYVDSSECAGYAGFENITIQGGTFNATGTHTYTPVRLTHANNITLKDFTVGGGNANHLVEAVSLSNFMIDGCTFRNMSKTAGTAREALQFDIAANEQIYPYIWQDGTMMKNVTVQNCTFSNVSRGVGTHSMLLNAYHENIKIINNTFDNVTHECIVALNYYNCEISGNKITNCGAGIIFQCFKANAATIYTTLQDVSNPQKGTVRHDLKATIKNNTIHTKYNGQGDSVCAIEVSGRNLKSKATNSIDKGTIPAGDYYISNVEVSGNKITTAGYGIMLQDAKNCNINNNTITVKNISSSDPIGKKKNYNAIHAGQASTKNKIVKNTITSAQKHGIYFQDDSSASEITGNVISKSGSDGIGLLSGSKVTGNITGNLITDSGENGIYIRTNSGINGSIIGNTITNCQNAVYINNKAFVDGNITGNTITTCKITGININKKSKIGGNIDGNKISACTKSGIQLYGTSAVNGKITGNTIKNVKLNGIAVAQSSKVKKGIISNTITKAKKYGIYVYDKGVVSKDITKNKITSANMPIVLSKNATGNVRKNTYKKNKSNVTRILSIGVTVKSVKKPAISSAKGKSKKVTLKWKKVKNVTGYYVELSTAKDFSKGVKKVDTKKLTATFKKLKKGKTYYVRVSAYKKYGKIRIYSDYSKVKKVVVK